MTAQDLERWGSNRGFLLATLCSAVGLGNVWRFSYVAGESGGGAFPLCPRFLDAATAALPALAIDALSREVSRFGSIALRTARSVALLHTDHAVELTRAQRTLAALDAAIDAFVVRLNRAGMTQESALRLATVLRRMTYYASVAELLPAVSAASQELPVPTSPAGAAVLTNVGLLR